MKRNDSSIRFDGEEIVRVPAKAFARDIRYDRKVSVRQMQNGEMSAISLAHVSTKEIVWLTKNGFTPVEFAGQLFF